MSRLDSTILLCYNCTMITEFTKLCPPHENGHGWYVPAGEDELTSNFLYDDGNIWFAPLAPDDCSGYFRTKAKAYLASINYYIKHSRDYPHEIINADADSITSQSTTMEFE